MMGADTITRTSRVTALAPWLLVLPATMAVFALLAVPVGSTLAESFSNPLGAFENYRRFFASDYNRIVVLRSFWIAFATTTIALAAGFFAAYLIAGSGPRTKRILILLSVFPLLTGVVVRSFGWMVILGRNGILNNALIELGLINAPLSLLFNQGAVLVGMVYLFLPLMILSLVGVLETIDQDLYSAAESLGSSPFGVFRQVTFPLALPGMVVGSILVFTGSLATFVTPRLLGGERQMTLATLLHEKAIISFDWEAANTIATIMIVLTAVSLVALGMLAKRLSPKGSA